LVNKKKKKNRFLFFFLFWFFLSLPKASEPQTMSSIQQPSEAAPPSAFEQLSAEQQALVVDEAVSQLVQDAVEEEAFELCVLYRTYKRTLASLDEAVADERYEDCIALRHERDALERQCPALVQRREAVAAALLLDLDSVELQLQPPELPSDLPSELPLELPLELPSSSLRASPSRASRHKPPLPLSPSPQRRVSNDDPGASVSASGSPKMRKSGSGTKVVRPAPPSPALSPARLTKGSKAGGTQSQVDLHEYLGSNGKSGSKSSSPPAGDGAWTAATSSATVPSSPRVAMLGRRPKAGSTSMIELAAHLGDSPPSALAPTHVMWQVSEGEWSTEKLDNGRVVVRGATLDKLVEQLAVADALPDWEFIEDFLISLRYFTTPGDVLTRLRARFEYALPESITLAEREAALKWKGPVQMRVVNILKKWIETHFYDFEPFDSSPLAAALRDFESGVVRETNERWATSLRDEWTNAMQNRAGRAAAAAAATAATATSATTASTKLPAHASLEMICYAMKQPATELLSEQKGKGMKKAELCASGAHVVSWFVGNVDGVASLADALALGERLVAAKLLLPCGAHGFANEAALLYQLARQPNDPLCLAYPPSLWAPSAPGAPPRLRQLTDVPVDELARQLTIMASAIYMRVTPSEVKAQAWAKADAKERAPNLTALISHFNRTSYWIAGQLVMTQDATQRGNVLKAAIKLADALFELRNYDGLFSIYLGLNLASTSRLKKTWALADGKQAITWERLSAFCSHEHNHKAYRTALKNAEPPALPYMAIYTADLTHIEDGNDDRTPDDKINFEKMRMIAAVWRDIARFQSARHAYCYRPIAEIQTWFADAPLLNDDELYKLSLVVEPRAAGANSPMQEHRARSASIGKMFGLRKQASVPSALASSSEFGQ
jgi:hypothetical protein